MADKNKKELVKTRTVFSALKSSIVVSKQQMNSDKISITGARDSEKKTMVPSIVYTAYVTEKRGNQVNID